MNLSGLGKLGAIIVVLVVGLDLYARWTGQTYSLNLLGMNAWGAAAVKGTGTGTATVAPQFPNSGPPLHTA